MINSNNKKLPSRTNAVDEYLLGLVKDGKQLLYDLEQSNADQFDVIEFYAEIPERPSPDIFIAMIMRWADIAKYYQRPVRVYSYVYNNKSEKYILALTDKREDIFVTIIPGYLRDKKPQRIPTKEPDVNE